MRWTKSDSLSSLKYASVRPKRITRRLSQQSPSTRLSRERARVHSKIKYVKSNGALKYSRRNLLRKQDSGTGGSVGVGLTKSDRRFNWNRSNARLSAARVSGVTVRCGLALAAGYNVFPGVSALFWADVDPVGNSPQPRQRREERKRERDRERKHRLSRARTRATAPLTLAAGIRERLSRESLRLENDSEALLFIFPCCRDLSSCLPCRGSANVCG